MSSFHKVFLKISQKLQSNTCATFQASGNFIKKEALGQVFSYEFCEIFKNTFLWNTAIDHFLNMFSFRLFSDIFKASVVDFDHVFVCWER